MHYRKESMKEQTDLLTCETDELVDLKDVRIDTTRPVRERMEEFLQQVALDQDVCQQARRRLRDMTNYSTDGQNAQRVTDFIIEKANL